MKREAGEWLAGIHLEVQAVLADLVSGSQQRQSGPKVRGGANLRLGVAEELVVKFQARINTKGQEAKSKSS